MFQKVLILMFVFQRMLATWFEGAAGPGYHIGLSASGEGGGKRRSIGFEQGYGLVCLGGENNVVEAVNSSGGGRS